jgi:hypothetical protein
MPGNSRGERVLPFLTSGTALKVTAARERCGPLMSGTMPDIEGDKFRREAEECRRNAEQTTNPKDREAWLRLAEDWMKLARGEAPKRESKQEP